MLYAIRLVYNVAAQAFFPVLLTDRGDIYRIGVAYWVYRLIADGFYWLRMAVANK